MLPYVAPLHPASNSLVTSLDINVTVCLLLVISLQFDFSSVSSPLGARASMAGPLCPTVDVIKLTLTYV